MQEIQQEEALATIEKNKAPKKRSMARPTNRTREGIIEDVINERKKIMKIEHNKKMEILDEQNKAKLAALEMKRQSMEAKRAYYEMKTFNSCK